MDLHTIIAQELWDRKSLSALVWLIDRGRELEFYVGDTLYFLSCSRSRQYVSLWEGRSQQSFESMDALLQQATIQGRPFLSMWELAQLGTLF